MQVDTIITAITNAECYDDALDKLHLVPAIVLRAIADQLYIDHEGMSTQTMKREIVKEARA